ncbi:MAG: trimethylamine methyltransferase family protein [Candidatus Firestonebacteria bacterium]
MKKLLQHFDMLSLEEIKLVEDTAFRVLSEVGVKIDNSRIIEGLESSGARADKTTGKVYFDRKYMENFLAGTEGVDQAIDPNTRASGGIGGYALNYYDPETDTIKKNTLKSAENIIKLADYLPNISSIMLGAVPGDIPPILIPLYGRYLLWRHSEKKWAGEACIWDIRLCPYIVEMSEIMKQDTVRTKKPFLQKYLNAYVFLISPLHFGKEEAEQYVWFWERGLYCNVTNMTTMGANAPVTIAGAMAKHLAESFFQCILDRVFYKRKQLYLGLSGAPIDMRNGSQPYGRPETQLMGIAGAQICRYYKSAGGSGTQGNTTSKSDDMESGLNLATGAMLGLLSTGGPGLDMDLLSVDEVISPVKMVLANEYADYVNRLLDGFKINKETLAFDVMKEVGTGGLFMDHEHTADHFKEEIWMPEFMSHEMMASWLNSGKKTFTEQARDKVLEVWNTYHPKGISDETEKKLLSVIERAKKELVK